MLEHVGCGKGPGIFSSTVLRLQPQPTRDQSLVEAPSLHEETGWIGLEVKRIEVSDPFPPTVDGIQNSAPFDQ